MHISNSGRCMDCDSVVNDYNFAANMALGHCETCGDTVGVELQYINCTPHAVTVAGVEFKPCGTVARVKTVRSNGDEEPATYASGRVIFSNGVPQEASFIIVSGMVVDSKAHTQWSFVSPDTNRAERNEQGHVVSTGGFRCHPDAWFAQR